MSNNKKKPKETPVDKYYKLSTDLKHQKRTLDIAQRNVDKTEHELKSILNKIWFCPLCNVAHNIPSKKYIKEQIESKLNEDDTTESFYKCYYALCDICGQYVLIDKKYMGDND